MSTLVTKVWLRVWTMWMQTRHTHIPSGKEMAQSTGRGGWLGQHRLLSKRSIHQGQKANQCPSFAQLQNGLFGKCGLEISHLCFYQNVSNISGKFWLSGKQSSSLELGILDPLEDILCLVLLQASHTSLGLFLPSILMSRALWVQFFLVALYLRCCQWAPSSCSRGATLHCSA